MGEGVERLRPYLSGGLAAVVAEMATFPLDTAKTRQQLQGQVGDRRWSSVRYRGVLHTLARMVREEGPRSVYRGLAPALLRQAVYGTIKFGLYYSSKDVARRVVKARHQRESNVVNLCCAVIAGSTSALVATPTDVIKVRMQSAGSVGGEGLSLVSLGSKIYREEGVRGLWRGGVPTAHRAAVVAGVQLPVYDAAKEQLLHLGARDGVACHFLASLVAGLSCCLASNPLDVVRTRMMVQRRVAICAPDRCSLATPPQGQFYTSPLHCAFHTVSTEGLAALYKGFLPAFARMGPWNAIFFLVYERLKQK